MKWMCKHIDNKIIIKFAIFIEFGEYIVIIIINYQHLILNSGMIFYILIKILNLI